MSRGFIKGSEIMSTDGVRHDKVILYWFIVKEKYFEEKESKGFVNSHYKEVKENKETNSKSAQSNKEKLPKLSSEGGLNDQNQDNQMIREEEEDKEWRLKMCMFISFIKKLDPRRKNYMPVKFMIDIKLKRKDSKVTKKKKF